MAAEPTMMPRKKRNAEPSNKIGSQKDETQDTLADKAEKKTREDAVRVVQATNGVPWR